VCLQRRQDGLFCEFEWFTHGKVYN
jgi:hypothetical protein